MFIQKPTAVICGTHLSKYIFDNMCVPYLATAAVCNIKQLRMMSITNSKYKLHCEKYNIRRFMY